MTDPIRLTKYSHGGGCGCKIAPGVLRKVIEHSSSPKDFPSLIVGNDTADDAAVMDLGNGTLLISTVDFFMPIVDDAGDFGRIAATNSISDVFAMGGKPVMAIAVLGWPIEKLSPELAQEVMAGAKEVCDKAGIPIAGGHTIDSPEPFFGLSVNGTVSRENLKTNSGGMAGDVLFLTKPIGVGILTTAAKRGMATEEERQMAIGLMTTLNSVGVELGNMKEVHALTDITGFGLLGHLIELCEASEVGAKIEKKNVPVIPAAKEMAQKMIYPDATFRNWKAFEGKVEGIDPSSLILFCDPQTSGGLLIAVSMEGAGAVEDLLKKHDLYSASIGELIPLQEKSIFLV